MRCAPHGEIPLPPYIHRAPEPEDRERYQTVFARVEGAVAAPTAGLHFSSELLGRLRGARVSSGSRCSCTSVPGPSGPCPTPIRAQHRMDEEYFEVGSDAAARLLEVRRRRDGRIVAVGNHRGPGARVGVRRERRSSRRRRAAGRASSSCRPTAFQAVDALITNFHLPRTTLLLLVAAFAGEELLRRAYAHAVAQSYRFYSYGDAMLVV